VKHRINTWALVLAGGEGRRLQGLTRDVHGAVVPKQFCSLRGGPSLLQDALRRAAAVAPLQRVCAVVAEQHRQWWTSMLGYLPDGNVIVQPQNRGTAHGILLPLLRLADRDPEASVVLLPADHYLHDEEVMVASLRQAADLANADRSSIYLLGIEPDGADTELGYILPKSRTRDGSATVLRFVEKPTESQARTLVDRGALWNSFIMAASVRALLDLFDDRYATTMAGMRGVEGAILDNVYARLDSLDFSRDVLQGNEPALKVLPVPRCGWSDLGTPTRIGHTLQRLRDAGIGSADRRMPAAYVNLAVEYARLQVNYAAKFGHVDLRA
jgi:mannose-1-phosphate guanylyltransferase